LARETEELLAQMLGLPCSLVEQWIHEGRYVMGPELVERGCAEMLPLPGAPIPVGKAKPSRPSE
ncbi:MAG: hypothetical protein KDB14_31550, partial [Planctomycetales bacterium]|nr:hypothetical protein [Planctomycetales bacterium]